MAKFCTNCGNACQEGDNVCTQCGTRLVNAQPQNEGVAFAQAESAAAKKSSHITGIVLIIVAFLIVAILIAILVPMLSKGYKKPVEQFMEAIVDEESEDLMDVFPEDFFDDMRDVSDTLELMYDDGEELVDEFFDYCAMSIDKYKGYEIGDAEKLDEDDLDDLMDFYEYKTDNEIEITKGYEVEVELDVKIDGESDTIDIEIYVCKVKEQGWKVIYDDFFTNVAAGPLG